jgi:hypothetical protein
VESGGWDVESGLWKVGCGGWAVEGGAVEGPSDAGKQAGENGESLPSRRHGEAKALSLPKGDPLLPHQLTTFQ